MRQPYGHPARIQQRSSALVELIIFACVAIGIGSVASLVAASMFGMVRW